MNRHFSQIALQRHAWSLSRWPLCEIRCRVSVRLSRLHVAGDDLTACPPYADRMLDPTTSSRVALYHKSSNGCELTEPYIPNIVLIPTFLVSYC